MLLPRLISAVCLSSVGNKLFKIEELPYKPNTYYIFNTQVEHTVYNFETTRYLLSIEFAKNKEQLTYDDLLKEVMAEYE